MDRNERTAHLIKELNLYKRKNRSSNQRIEFI